MTVLLDVLVLDVSQVQVQFDGDGVANFDCYYLQQT
jgi:hypothetical protein